MLNSSEAAAWPLSGTPPGPGYPVNTRTIRWLLRAIAAMGLAALLLAVSQWVLHAVNIAKKLQISLPAAWQRDRRLGSIRLRIAPTLATA